MIMPTGPFRPFLILSFVILCIALMYPGVQVIMMDKTVDVAPLSATLSKAEKKELQVFSEYLETIQIHERDDVYEMFDKTISNNTITKEKKHILNESKKKNELEKQPFREQVRIGLIIFAISIIPVAIETYILRDE